MGADSTDIIARLAGAQHGAVAVRQVIEAGVTRRWIDNLVDRDVLRRTAAGVYVVNGSEPTWHQRLSVGLLSLGDQAWVSFEAAAALHRFDRALREPVDFTVLRELRNRAKACPYRVHTTVTMPPIDVVNVDGFPCTAASRNVLDLALGRVPTIRLEAAIDSAIRRGLSSQPRSASASPACEDRDGGGSVGSTNCCLTPAAIRCSSGVSWNWSAWPDSRGRGRR